MRYPYELDNAILLEYLRVFSRLAGNADEMGSFIKRLKTEMASREIAYEAELQASEGEKQTIIKAFRRSGAEQVIGREGETATFLSRCLFNSELRGFG